MGLLNLLKCFLISLVLLLPLLWLLSTTFRYYVRMTVYYSTVFMSSTFSFFWMLPTFGDVNNYKKIQSSFLFLTKIFQVKWEVRGKEHIQSDNPFVAVCNHQSSLDFMGMMETWPERCVAMVKSSLKYFGFMGVAAIGSGTILVERFKHDKNAAAETVSNVVEQLKQKNAKIWIFPEGTRHHEVGMLPFKKGAFYIAVQAQVPIVPIVFSSYHFFYSKPEKRFLSKGFVLVQVLPPISTKGLTADDVPELSVKVREQMLKVYDKISLEAEERFNKSQY